MAPSVRRSAAFLLAGIVLSGCGPGGLFGPTYTSSGASQTGTATVRGRIQQLRADQQALASGIATQQGQLATTRAQMSADTGNYQGLVRNITSRLTAGTTPGNPELVDQWNEAQARLDAVTMGVGQLNSLASQVTTQASVAGYLLDNVRSTYAVGGAVDADHRELRSIESETGRSLQDVDRLIGDLNAEIARENGFLARERSVLAGLSYNINVGRTGAYPLQQRGAPSGGLPRRVVLGGPQASGAPTQLSSAPQ